MKNLIWLPCLFVISACGGGDSTADDTTTATDDASVEAAASEDAATVSQSADLPWDIPTIPNARVIHSASAFSRGSERRGGESTALIAFEGTAGEIVGFYNQALPELGFQITNISDLDETSSTLNAEHADGRTLQIFANRGGSNARDGESSATLVATQPISTE